MHLALVEQLPPHRLARPALEKHVVRNDHEPLRPWILSKDLTCWTKLSCLFDVVVQKSGRLSQVHRPMLIGPALLIHDCDG